jgi:hypothetical protein
MKKSLRIVMIAGMPKANVALISLLTYSSVHILVVLIIIIVMWKMEGLEGMVTCNVIIAAREGKEREKGNGCSHKILILRWGRYRYKKEIPPQCHLFSYLTH